MRLARSHAVAVAQIELDCLHAHVAILFELAGIDCMGEWAAGVEQLRIAITRLQSDITATRTARMQ